MNGKNTPVSKTLADLLESRGTLTQDQILTLLKPVMTALTQLHKQNRVHGHISPETITLHDNSRLFFCCPLSLKTQTGLLANIKASGNSLGYTFSLASCTDGYVSDDLPYRALETYMNGPLTPAADVYSLCAVMYHALTGTPPKTAQELMYADSDIFSDISAATGLAPAEIIAKGIALLPKNRYTDIKELASVLNALTVSKPKTMQKDAEKEPFKEDSKIFPDEPTIKYTRNEERIVLPADFLDILTAKYKKSGQNFRRDSITAIVFDWSLSLPPDSIFSAQIIGDGVKGNTVAWTEKDSVCTGFRDGICLHISADGIIHADVSCSGMFADCQNLERIDFNRCLDTSAAVDMSRMFYGCSSLSSLNLAGFDTSKVQTMESMFKNCSHPYFSDLREIVTNLDFSGITGGGLKNMVKGTAFERELTSQSQSIASHPPVEQLLKPMERVRLLCEDFASKHPKRYNIAISDVLKTGLGLNDQKVYLSHDDTWLKSGKNGFAVTDHGFVCHLLPECNLSRCFPMIFGNLLHDWICYDFFQSVLCQYFFFVVISLCCIYKSISYFQLNISIICNANDGDIILNTDIGSGGTSANFSYISAFNQVCQSSFDCHFAYIRAKFHYFFFRNFAYFMIYHSLNSLRF